MVPTKSSYIHIPFCLSKCRYCGFNSAPVPPMELVDQYCRAIEQEIRISDFGFRNLETVYFGGGTPTILDPKRVSDIMSAFRKRAEIGREAEITIEANPETADPEKLRALRAMGFNRLSLGVQSFDDGVLKLLGRAHDGRRALQAFGDARRAGFGNVGIDLIFGIPGQGPGQWEEELKQAVALDPEHISAYSLTYEPGTEFTSWRDSGRIRPCNEDLEAGMFLAAREMLGLAGYGHYEVSSYAKPGFRSRHNLNYWHCGDYLGFGAGAHSHLEGRRWANAGPYAEYSEKIVTLGTATTFEEILTKDQRLFEAVFLGLRMVEGIDSEAFKAKWGLSPQEYKPEAWKSLEKDGLLVAGQNNPRLTEKGLLLSDLCLARFAS